MGAIFSKIKAKNAGIAEAKASIFNEDIWKKSPILLSSLSSQSTIVHKNFFLTMMGCFFRKSFTYSL
jgi:hypothetical protein